MNVIPRPRAIGGTRNRCGRNQGPVRHPSGAETTLAIKPKTKLAVYRKGDKLVVTKLKVPTAGKELDDFFVEIDEDNKERKVASGQEILQEIQAYRKEKRARRN